MIGTVLVGAIGYGAAILFTLIGLRCFRTTARYAPTSQEAFHALLACGMFLALALGAAGSTRWILGAAL
ncbi:hypothetical protein [Methylobacterium nodulans]|uniref:Uncharacterized protein n=1 Tax=Methylobacterium nodulans (strain LMG 21967 / CNCM I-2342 / ORS 2060) TaxID=460265 RepID=B8IAP8_METNO|nr:hypothetical protein [Methylobacterium nodulans]ACL61093.1 conserved hypothetical protein [Methylobacterium nodulans ORS 2060]